MQLKIDNITIDIPKNKEQEVRSFIISLIGGGVTQQPKPKSKLKRKKLNYRFWSDEEKQDVVLDYHSSGLTINDFSKKFAGRYNRTYPQLNRMLYRLINNK